MQNNQTQSLLTTHSELTSGLGREQIDLIKKTVAKDATDTELDLFVYHCNKTGLDPLARQIYFQKRPSKNGPQMTILTAIDGYRLIADRTGKYAGNDDPVFDNENVPRRATVTVWKLVAGVRSPFTATARWDQYYPGDAQGFMWRKMPHLMLGKCAEALALRKAFPAELSGLYTTEEMEQADNPPPPSKPTIDPNAFDNTNNQHRERLEALLEKSFKDVPKARYASIAERMVGRPMNRKAVDTVVFDADVDQVFAEPKQ